MLQKDTPPSSPYDITESMEDDLLLEEELHESDIEELIDENDINTTSDIEDDEGENINEDNEEIKDDAQYTFSNHEGSVFCCHLDPKTGSLAVTGGEDDIAYVWNTHSGEIVLECKGHKDSVICVGFNYDGSYLATGDMSGLIQVWKMSNKSMVWETQIEDLSWLRWHHGANVLLGCTLSGEIYMWRIPGGHCKVLPGDGEKSSCGVIMPDGKRVAVGYENGSVKIFDMKGATVLHRIVQGQGHVGSVTDMDCYTDNNLIISGGEDGRAILMTTQTGKISSILDCKIANQEAESVEAVAFCRDNSLPLAATGSLDGLLCIWDISRGIQREMVKQDSGIIKLFWVKNTHLLCTAGMDGTVRLFDGRNGSLLSVLKGHTDNILDMSLSPDCRTLLTSSDDSTARIFSIPDSVQ